MKTINLSKLASSLSAYHNKTTSPEWKSIHEENIESMNGLLPHGSGIDGICYIDINLSSKDKIVIFFEFHHMNENGYYDGWTNHLLTLTPSFIFGYDMKISGKNKNNIKDYLHQTFSEVFSLNSDTCPVS